MVELLRIIDKLLETDYCSPSESSIKLRQEVFEQRSYARWTLLEFKMFLIARMKNCETIGVLGEIGIFREKMNQLSLINEKGSYIFSVAYDTMTDLLDRYIMITYENWGG